ncbi:hypothetical protein [Streptomyces sp. NPDC050145]|uniref:hypothetical protein n=1 Tax=Streptomyces sp. NPDC050145 TaxID=3365602 RepID=UPI00379D1DCC
MRTDRASALVTRGVLDEARDAAAALATDGPLALRVGKDVVAGALHRPADDAVCQRFLLEPADRPEGAAEGTRAFAERHASLGTGRR